MKLFVHTQSKHYIEGIMFERDIAVHMGGVSVYYVHTYMTRFEKGGISHICKKLISRLYDLRLKNARKYIACGSQHVANL